MWLYSVLSRPFPRSFMAKVFAVAFVGTHLPVLSLLCWVVLRGVPWDRALPALGVVFAATVSGTALTLLLLRSILAPLYRVEAAMRAFETDGTVLPLPFGYEDQIGRLMDSTNRLVLSVEDRLDENRRAAETDPLTGLLNRRGFDQRVPPEPVGAMLMLDLDGFKGINDRFGHALGDAVLRDLSGILSVALRRRDVLARFGGEEFVIFLPSVTLGEAREIAERLRGHVAVRLRAGEVGVTVSIGVALGRIGLGRDELIAEADRGLYLAKQGGRNRVCVAS